MNHKNNNQYPEIIGKEFKHINITFVKTFLRRNVLTIELSVRDLLLFYLVQKLYLYKFKPFFDKIYNKFSQLSNLAMEGGFKSQITNRQVGGGANDNSFSSNYGYSEINEITRFFKNLEGYKVNRVDGLFKVRFEQAYNDNLKIISTNNGKIDNLLTIGCSYAKYESLIAQNSENINVKCFDRSVHTSIMNRDHFTSKNINFFHGDVFKFISEESNHKTIFNHIWTAAYLPKEFIERIYCELMKNKAKYIYLIEPVGVSLETGEMYCFSNNDTKSVSLRGNIYIHNYPGIIKKYGYRVINSELLKIPENKSRYLLKILAKLY